MIINILNKSKKTNEITTKTICVFTCDNCGVEDIRAEIRCQKVRKKFGCDLCKKCLKVNIHQSSEYKLNMSKSINAMIKKDPDWCNRNSKSKKGKINLGEKNGMKQDEARKKASKTRKKMLEDESLRKQISEKIKQAWADGKYDFVSTGRSKWFNYTKKDGTTCKVQGTYELKFASFLEKSNIEFLTHVHRIKYIMNSETKSYYPDFFIINENRYIEIKCDYFLNLQKDKFDAIRQSNTDLNLEILSTKELQQLGIVL